MKKTSKTEDQKNAFHSFPGTWDGKREGGGALLPNGFQYSEYNCVEILLKSFFHCCKDSR